MLDGLTNACSFDPQSFTECLLYAQPLLGAGRQQSTQGYCPPGMSISDRQTDGNKIQGDVRRQPWEWVGRTLGDGEGLPCGSEGGEGAES